MAAALRRGIPAAVALVVTVTVTAGLALRAVTDGVVAKVGGVALYGTMIYLLVGLLRSRFRRRTGPNCRNPCPTRYFAPPTAISGIFTRDFRARCGPRQLEIYRLSSGHR